MSAAEKIRQFASAHSATLTVAGVFLALAAVLAAYKSYSSEKTIRVDRISYTAEQAMLDAKHAADDLAARNRVDAYLPPEQSTGPMAHIALLPDAELIGIAPPDKTPMQLLEQMGGGPQEPEPSVSFSDKDLSTTVVYPMNNPGPGLAVSSSALDDIDRKNSAVLVSAPISHLVFSEPNSYKEFRRLHPDSNLPQDVDFSRQRVAVLVSASSMPNKIFSVLGFDDSAQAETVVKYQVNPMAASEEGPDRYSFAVLAKSSKPLRLEQQR